MALNEKKVIVFTSMFLLWTVAFGQGTQKTNPLIKSEEITYHGIDRRHINRVDRKGLDEYREYNADGTVSKIYIVEFDKNKGKNSYNLNERYVYEKGKLNKIEEIGTNTAEKCQEVLFSYNEKMQLVKKIENQFQANKLVMNQLSAYTDYCYNVNEEIEKRYEYDETKQEFLLTSIITKIYDLHKNMIQEKTENFDGNISGIVNIKYDNFNKPIALESSYFKETKSYKYNSHGDLEEEKTESEKRSTIELSNYSYIYDNYGNWIEQKEIIKRNPKDEFEGGLLIKRKIEYY
ncbi:hypothetical protein OHD16_13950 [Sphingobacterium sp. ML3W]|uniref:hypothetical protein n=1 Tax=Sphingobacterium sp. ML3W TaxID=1538644 RepID=UPI00249C5C0F|nr:hypothetical protein [Sphingobacterium sp. ML3W]WFA81062.1 hypothetical protein OGI71_07095 [Sphingobacterium sp. ML3W]